MSTIFSKIIAGEIPAHVVYEDEQVMAFLDVGPIARGHTLVVPKAEVATLDELDDEDAAAIGRVLPRLSRAILEATGAEAFNVLQNNGEIAGQSVHHVHFHIIPKFADAVDPAGGSGMSLNWPAKALPDDAPDLAATIRVLVGPDV